MVVFKVIARAADRAHWEFHLHITQAVVIQKGLVFKQTRLLVHTQNESLFASLALELIFVDNTVSY